MRIVRIAIGALCAAGVLTYILVIETAGTGRDCINTITKQPCNAGYLETSWTSHER